MENTGSEIYVTDWRTSIRIFAKILNSYKNLPFTDIYYVEKMIHVYDILINYLISLNVNKLLDYNIDKFEKNIISFIKNIKIKYFSIKILFEKNDVNNRNEFIKNIYNIKYFDNIELVYGVNSVILFCILKKNMKYSNVIKQLLNIKPYNKKLQYSNIFLSKYQINLWVN